MIASSNSRNMIDSQSGRPRRMTASGHFTSTTSNQLQQLQADAAAVAQNQTYHHSRRSHFVQRQYALRSYFNNSGFTNTSPSDFQATSVSALPLLICVFFSSDPRLICALT